MKRKTVLFSASLAGIAFSSLAALPAAAQSVYSGEGPVLIFAEQLNWVEAPAVAPGAKIAVLEGPLNKAVPFTFRLKLPANSRVAPHTHPAYERVTVLSGTFFFTDGAEYDPAKAKPLRPGAVAIMPPGTPMFGYTKDETVIQLHGIGPWGLKYLNAADDPRKP